MAPKTDAGESSMAVLPKAETSMETDEGEATAVFENGARIRMCIDEDGEAREEFYSPKDSDDDPSIVIEKYDFDNPSSHLGATLIEYREYCSGNKHEQLESDWGNWGIAEVLMGCEVSDTTPQDGYIEREPGTCCEEPLCEQTNFVDDGEVAYSYTTCQNCGAEWRDVYQYLHSERKVE